MSLTTEQLIEGVKELTPEEGRAFFEDEVQRLLGITAKDFLRRLDAGEYNGVYDTPGYWQIGHLELLSHVVR
jgi:hypothetical protein